MNHFLILPNQAAWILSECILFETSGTSLCRKFSELPNQTVQSINEMWSMDFLAIV